MKTLSTWFFVLAALLSDAMCAVTAYNLCTMQWGIRYDGFSAPVSAAFLPAIPFALAVAVCLALAVHCRKRERS